MTVASFCLLVVCVLPIVCAGIAKSGTFSTPRSQGGYDNRDPRAWLARQTGRRARANAAQANSFEALPLFIAAVLAAQQAGASQGYVDALAVFFKDRDVLNHRTRAKAYEDAMAVVAARHARGQASSDSTSP